MFFNLKVLLLYTNYPNDNKRLRIKTGDFFMQVSTYV